MYGYGYTDFISIIVMIPAMILVMIAQGKVTSNFSRFSRVKSGTGLTGAEAARRMLDRNGLQNVQINPVRGSLTDHYDPRTRTVNLSEDVYGIDSVSAVSVACHECGHAMQHAHNYFPLTFRGMIVPVVNIASSASWFLVIAGFILMAMSGSHSEIGMLLLNIGILAFVAVVIFHLVTLPVELNASRRALNQLKEMSLVTPENMVGAKKVLGAAALTYVGALAMALANLLRVIILASASRRR